MKKIFDKHETLICILLILLYVVINSFCVQNFGIADYRSALVNTVFSVLLFLLIVSLKGLTYYGFTKVNNIKDYWYFIPLLFIVSVNFWNGIKLDNSIDEILFHVITMLNVGFIEEVIFRGFLFRMMAKDSVKAAIIVSSVTFGIGHIVNLFNGADLLPTLLQICYAMAVGFLFVIIFYKSGSIIPCILAHSLNNSFSIFGKENEFSLYIGSLFLIVVSTVYAICISKKSKQYKI
ncbi:MAG: CPBP family intramembrane metalloprotease [Ruminococcaceae bacterium]|nr:CPBP family intramembrane metalloprotease [Oscillospiraceae bacterium]